MALPDDELSEVVVRGRFVSPDDRYRHSLLRSVHGGGPTLNDGSEGLTGYVWVAEYDGSNVEIWREDVEARSTLFSAAGITEISLAFDQQMQPAIAYMQSGACKLWWYDGTVPGYDIVTVSGATSPVIKLDDPRLTATNAGTSDMLVFFIKSSKLYHRRQQDRFLTDMELYDPAPGSRIGRCGLATNLRFTIEFPTAAGIVAVTT